MGQELFGWVLGFHEVRGSIAASLNEANFTSGFETVESSGIGSALGTYP